MSIFALSHFTCDYMEHSYVGSRCCDNSSYPLIPVDKKVIKVASSFSQGAANLVIGWNTYAADVEKLTRGTVVFEFTETATVSENAFNSYQLVREGRYDAALHDANYAVTAYQRNNSFFPVDASFGLTANVVPFGMKASTFLEFVTDHQAIIQKIANIHHVHSVHIDSAGGQISGYLSKCANVTEFKKDPVAWYNGKRGRVGGNSALVLNEFGADAKGYDAATFFQGIADCSFDFGEFINPFVDEALAKLVQDDKVGAVLMTTWGESAPGATLDIDLAVWNSLEPYQQEAMTIAAYRNHVQKVHFMNKNSYNTLNTVYANGNAEIIDVRNLKSNGRPFLDIAHEKWNLINAQKKNESTLWNEFLTAYEEVLELKINYVNIYPETPMTVNR